jgi:hypothetical protein
MRGKRADWVSTDTCHLLLENFCAKYINETYVTVKRENALVRLAQYLELGLCTRFYQKIA